MHVGMAVLVPYPVALGFKVSQYNMVTDTAYVNSLTNFKTRECVAEHPSHVALIV